MRVGVEICFAIYPLPNILKLAPNFLEGKINLFPIQQSGQFLPLFPLSKHNEPNQNKKLFKRIKTKMGSQESKNIMGSQESKNKMERTINTQQELNNLAELQRKLSQSKRYEQSILHMFFQQLASRQSKPSADAAQHLQKLLSNLLKEIQVIRNCLQSKEQKKTSLSLALMPSILFLYDALAPKKVQEELQLDSILEYVRKQLKTMTYGEEPLGETETAEHLENQIQQAVQKIQGFKTALQDPDIKRCIESQQKNLLLECLNEKTNCLVIHESSHQPMECVSDDFKLIMNEYKSPTIISLAKCSIHDFLESVSKYLNEIKREKAKLELMSGQKQSNAAHILVLVNIHFEEKELNEPSQKELSDLLKNIIQSKLHVCILFKFPSILLQFPSFSLSPDAFSMLSLNSLFVEDMLRQCKQSNYAQQNAVSEQACIKKINKDLEQAQKDLEALEKKVAQQKEQETQQVKTQEMQQQMHTDTQLLEDIYKWIQNNQREIQVILDGESNAMPDLKRLVQELIALQAGLFPEEIAILFLLSIMRSKDIPRILTIEMVCRQVCQFAYKSNDIDNDIIYQLLQLTASKLLDSPPISQSKSQKQSLDVIRTSVAEYLRSQQIPGQWKQYPKNISSQQATKKIELIEELIYNVKECL